MTMKQEEIDKLMRDMGVVRYVRRKTLADQHGKGTWAAPGARLFKFSVEPVTEAIKKWKRDSAKARHSSLAYGRLEEIRDEVLAAVASQVIIDQIGKEAPYSSTCFSIGKEIETEAQFNHLREHCLWDFRHGMQLIKKVAKHNSDRSMKFMRKLSRDADSTWEPWNHETKIRVGSILCELFAQATGAVKIEKTNYIDRNRRYRSRTIIQATEETLTWLQDCHAYHESKSPLYLPMVEKPVRHTNAFDGGYPSAQCIPRPVVINTTNRKMLKSVNPETVPTVFTAIHALAETPFSVNQNVLEVAKHFQETGIGVGDLPPRDIEPMPTKPENWDTMDADAKKAHNYLLVKWKQTQARTNSHRVAAARVLWTANEFAASPAFYFPHRLDFRGRAYPIPEFFQPQGNDISRGILQFAKGVRVDSGEARDYFAAHGASLFGLGRKSWEERVAWPNQSVDLIRAVAADPLECSTWRSADKPFAFLAWCFEWNDLLEDGFVDSHLPVSLDGSNNGLQLYSLLLRDPTSGAATNVLPSDKPRDIYRDVAERMGERLKALSESEEAGATLAEEWLTFVGGTFPRGAVKRPVMTLPYGCTKHSSRTYLLDWYTDESRTKGDYFGHRRWKAASFLNSILWEVIGEVVRSARECMAWLQNLSSICVAANKSMRWTSPSGFPVEQRYPKMRSISYFTSCGPIRRNVSWSEPTDKLSRRKMTGGAAPNFVHSLDAAVMMRIVESLTKVGITDIVAVHDCFAVHAAHAPRLAKIIRESVIDVFTPDLLENLRQELTERTGLEFPPHPPLGDMDINQVRDSRYFFS